MTAKLATVDDRILARVEESAAGRCGSKLSPSASDKQQVGSLQFGCGYLSPYFVTDPERMEAVFENAYVLVHEKKISSKKDLLPLLDQITKSGKPLLIVAEDVGSEALATLVVNKLRGPLRVAAVRAPGSGDQRKHMLQDVARLTGGKAIIEDSTSRWETCRFPTSVRPRRSLSTRTTRLSRAELCLTSFRLSLGPTFTQMVHTLQSSQTDTVPAYPTSGALLTPSV